MLGASFPFRFREQGPHGNQQKIKVLVLVRVLRFRNTDHVEISFHAQIDK
nr:MAG TPA: hypothetical protein [Caudoviricetes sp.]